MSRKMFVFLAGCLGIGLNLFWAAQWISEEAMKRAAAWRQSEAAQDFLRQHSQEIEAGRSRLAQWEARTTGSVEARLVDVVSRFQRRRDDFRLVALSQAPEGIILEAECRSQADVEFLFFCDRELLDLAPTRISLGCPPGTRVGSLRMEIAFGRLRLADSSSVASIPSSASLPPLSTLSPRTGDLGLRP
ncbi:hypothetical protein [Verrucomicrobium sp. 3C]|uniref:hypothetical protein n=1 Tax=Verrucomicrobium sp. 3C TaxID=1134055 RepID=UPI00035DA5F1|nr:hypothetical protein [Verrucomicrobium sp. 3C]